MSADDPDFSPAAAAVLALIVAKQGVTFVEIDEILTGQGITTHGDLAFFHGDADDNFVLWSNASEELLDVVNELLGAKAVHYVTTTPLVYAIDGYLPTLPLARNVARYKTPHWVPVVFNPGPEESGGRGR